MAEFLLGGGGSVGVLANVEALGLGMFGVRAKGAVSSKALLGAGLGAVDSVEIENPEALAEK